MRRSILNKIEYFVLFSAIATPIVMFFVTDAGLWLSILVAYLMSFLAFLNLIDITDYHEIKEKEELTETEEIDEQFLLLNIYFNSIAIPSLIITLLMNAEENTVAHVVIIILLTITESILLRTITPKEKIVKEKKEIENRHFYNDVYILNNLLKETEKEKVTLDNEEEIYALKKILDEYGALELEERVKLANFTAQQINIQINKIREQTQSQTDKMKILNMIEKIKKAES